MNKSSPKAKGPKTTDRNNNSKSLQQNCKTREIVSHAPPHQPSGDENAKQEEQQRETKIDNVQSQVTLIGDSMLHGMNDRGFMNCQRKVYVEVNPGANTQDIFDHMKPSIHRKLDTLIVRTGTNDVINDTDT